MLEQVDSIPIIHAFDFTLYFNTMTEQENQDNNPDLDKSDLVQDVEGKQQTSDQDTENSIESNDLENELISAQEEIAKLKDAFLRAKAEEDNVRRRAEKEVSNSRKFAIEGFAKEMLGVYDSLKLAVAVQIADDADDAVKSVHEGVNITLKQLQSAFSKFSLSEVSPEVGDKLDPNIHQAMSLVESEEVDSGCVLNVIQAGFKLNDRLLRPAMVVVVK